MTYLCLFAALLVYIVVVAHIPRANTGIKGPCVKRELSPPHFDPAYRPELFGGEPNSVHEIKCKNWRVIY